MRCEHADRPRAARVLRRHDPERALVVEQRLAVDGVGHDDVVAREAGIELREREHHLIAVGGARQRRSWRRRCRAARRRPARRRASAARRRARLRRRSCVPSSVCTSTRVRGNALSSAGVSDSGFADVAGNRERRRRRWLARAQPGRPETPAAQQEPSAEARAVDGRASSIVRTHARRSSSGVSRGLEPISVESYQCANRSFGHRYESEQSIWRHMPHCSRRKVDSR